MAMPLDGYIRRRAEAKATILLLLSCGCLTGQAPLAVVSAADYAGFPLTPDSIVSMFAANITTGISGAVNPPPAPLPTTLGGVSATLTDSSGNEFSISLIAVTPNQVNAVLPDFDLTNYAPMTVTLTTSSGTQLNATVSLAWTSPSIFTADESGEGPPAAQLVIAHADGSQTFFNSIADCSESGCVPVPIALGAPTDEAVLELFGTGIRGVRAVCPLGASCVTAMAFGTSPPCPANPSLPILYYGPQGGDSPDAFYGLDQVNVELPNSLTGCGTMHLALAVAPDPEFLQFNGFEAGQPQQSNIVTINIQ